MGGAGRLVFWNKQRSMPWIVFVKYSWHEQIVIERCPSALSDDLLETMCLFSGFQGLGLGLFQNDLCMPARVKVEI